jgi:hypothetical protein
MSTIEPNLPALARFGALFAVTSVAFFFMLGLFPLARRPSGTKISGALLLIGTNLGAWLVLAAATAIYGWTELRWTSLVIGGGLIFLLAPMLLETLLPHWQIGRMGSSLYYSLSSLASVCWLTRASSYDSLRLIQETDETKGEKHALPD